MTREWIAVPPGLPLGDAYRFIEHQFEMLFVDLAHRGCCGSCGHADDSDDPPSTESGPFRLRHEGEETP